MMNSNEKENINNSQENKSIDNETLIKSLLETYSKNDLNIKELKKLAKNLIKQVENKNNNQNEFQQNNPSNTISNKKRKLN